MFGVEFLVKEEKNKKRMEKIKRLLLFQSHFMMLKMNKFEVCLCSGGFDT
jgi:hypothetical protein